MTPTTTPDDEYGWLREILGDDDYKYTEKPHKIISHIQQNYEPKVMAATTIKCMDCGKDVSTPVSPLTLVRAVVSCPECYQKQSDEEAEKERRAYKQGWDSAGGENVFTRSEVERVKREVLNQGHWYSGGYGKDANGFKVGYKCNCGYRASNKSTIHSHVDWFRSQLSNKENALGIKVKIDNRLAENEVRFDHPDGRSNGFIIGENKS